MDVRATDEFAAPPVAGGRVLDAPLARRPTTRGPGQQADGRDRPPAQDLIDATSTELPDRERPGTVLYYGAGPVLDAIQRCCAATGTDPDPLHTDTQ